MDRRSFVAGSLAGAALGPLAQRATAANDQITTGMIGVGNRGAWVLQEILKQPAAKVTALCDIKPDRLDKAATLAARDKPSTFRDYRDLLAQPGLDAVFIDSPCHLHVEMAIAALKAGKHVYCEKPVGITPESIKQLRDVARATNRVFCVGQQMRSFSSVKQVVDQIQQGVAGKIVMVKAQRHSPADLPHDASSADWFFDAKKSGDVIVEMSVHNLDLCNWIIGQHPERAAGFGGALLWKNDPPGRTNMDGYTLSYEYPNDVKMSYTQVFFHPSGLPGGGQYVYAYGTKGAVDVLEGKFHPFGKNQKPVVLANQEAERDAPHLAGFYEAIRTGKKPPADIEIGATAALTAILGREAIYRKTMLSWSDLGVGD